MKRLALALILIFTVFSTTAYAFPIVSSAFSSGAGIEGFEGPFPTLSPVAGNGGGYLEPSFGFTFPSGVTLTGTGTNPGVSDGADGGVVIGNVNLFDSTNTNCSGGTQCPYWELIFNGQIKTSSDVLFGNGFIGLDDDLDDGNTPPIEFSFGWDVLRVGAFVAATDCFGFCSVDLVDDVTLKVFDAFDTELESLTLSGDINLANWGSNFIGIEHAGIRKVQFSGDFMVLDKLMFEPVPEPATLLLLGSGLTGLAFFRRRRRIKL